jgi:hypothetical protein
VAFADVLYAICPQANKHGYLHDAPYEDRRLTGVAGKLLVINKIGFMAMGWGG